MLVKKDYKNLWMSPNIVITRLNSLINKYGADTAFKSLKFQKEREAWITAVFLLGYQKLLKKEYWIEIETNDSTPDTYGYYLDVIKNKNHKMVFNFEIVEYEDHSKNLLDLIKNKCLKSYPNFYFLLVYLRKPGEVIYLENIFQELKKTKIPFLEIWSLGVLNSKGEYIINRLYSERLEIVFNLNDAQNNNKKQIEFCTCLKRDSGTEVENLGTINVPLPEIN